MQVRAGIYVRVSTDEQKDFGYSIDDQIRELTSFCEKKSYTIIGVYNDAGHSAKDMNRPNMQRLIDDIKGKKIDAVVALKLDRISRDSYDSQWFKKLCAEHECEIHLVSENYDLTTLSGNMMYGITSLFAEHERKEIGRRTKRGLEKNKHPNYGTHVHLFSSLIRCPDCNKILSSSMSYKYDKNKKVRKKYFFLYCRNQVCSSKGTYYNTGKLEAKLIRVLKELTMISIQEKKSLFKPNFSNEDEVEQIEKAIKKLENQEKKLMDLYMNSNINVTMINEHNSAIKSEIERLKETHSELIKEKIEEEAPDIFEHLEKFDYDNPFKIDKIWEFISPKVKKRIINKYIASIDINRNDDYEIDIVNINFNKDYFEANTVDYLTNLLNDNYKSITINPEPITEENVLVIAKDNKLISLTQFDSLSNENQMDICDEILSHFGNEGVEVRKYIINNQVIDTYFVLPLLV